MAGSCCAPATGDRRGSRDTLEDLGAALSTAFATRFPAVGARRGAANGMGHLRFTALGRPVDRDQFRPPGMPLAPVVARWARQATAESVDVLPGGGSAAVETPRRLSRAYAALVAAAVPAAGDSERRQEAARRIGDARLLLEHLREPSIYGSADSFLPVVTTPADWYDPPGSAWTTISVPACGPTTGGTWDWRVLRAAPSLERWVAARPEIAVERLLAGGPALRALRMSGALTRSVPPAAPSGVAAVGAAGGGRPAVDVALPASAVGRVVAARPVELLPDLLAESDAVPADAGGVAVSLSCCPVAIERRWLSDSLFATRGWQVPGCPPGFFSAGEPSRVDQLLPTIPVGFALVREVRLTADWSVADVARMRTAAGFGPFLLAGATVDAARGTLTIPGPQIVAWFCAIPPVLPPTG